MWRFWPIDTPGTSKEVLPKGELFALQTFPALLLHAMILGSGGKEEGCELVSKQSVILELRYEGQENYKYLNW